MAKKIYDWHRWFAWYPVRIDGKCMWGRWVERRRNYFQPLFDELRLPPKE
jgi:hypothetical protein